MVLCGLFEEFIAPKICEKGHVPLFDSPLARIFDPYLTAIDITARHFDNRGEASERTALIDILISMKLAIEIFLPTWGRSYRLTFYCDF